MVTILEYLFMYLKYIYNFFFNITYVVIINSLLIKIIYFVIFIIYILNVRHLFVKYNLNEDLILPTSD